jgi:hypothetical protein
MEDRDNPIWGGTMSPLILKRAKVSRPSGQWRDDDYDVICEGAVVGRVFLKAAPDSRPWMWTLAYGYRGGRTPDAWFNASVNWFTHGRPNAF